MVQDHIDKTVTEEAFRESLEVRRKALLMEVRWIEKFLGLPSKKVVYENPK